MLHLFHLTGLEPEGEYVLRATATDRRGHSAESQAIRLRTTGQTNALRLAQAVAGEPVVLDKAGCRYLLMTDITADGTALRIAASGVTLDLDGHEVVYNQEAADQDGEALAGLGEEEQEGASPSVGLTAGGGGADGWLSGLVCRGSSEGARVHHNTIADEGRLIRNRHRMCCAIRLASVGNGHLHHNLVVRTRQSALGNTGQGVHVHHNELHIDSHSINSFGIAVKDGSRVHDNRIFGCGDNAVGMVTTGGCRDVELHDNYIWLQAHDISEYLRHLNLKEMESSPYSIMSGVRITWGAIAGVGIETRGEVQPLVLSGNTIVSNFACFNMQDTYGVAINYHFMGNTFVRVGTRAGFATVRAREIRPSKGHVLCDNEWVGGADLDHVLLGPEDAKPIR